MEDCREVTESTPRTFLTDTDLKDKISYRLRKLLRDEDSFDWFTPEESKELLIARALKYVLRDIVIYVNGVCYEYDGRIWRHYGSERAFYLALKILFKELKRRKTEILADTNGHIDWQMEIKLKKLSSLLYYTTSVHGNKTTLQAFKNNFPDTIKFSSEIFNRDLGEDMLSCNNTVVDLRNMRHLDHIPCMYLTNIIDCNFKEYDKNNNVLDKLLGEVFNSEEQVELIKLTLGYCITDSTHWKTAFLFTGPPNAGKSLLIHLLYETLSSIGEDSSYITAVQTMMFHSKSSSNSMEYSLRRFYRKRIVVCPEFTDFISPNIDLIKQIIGHDVITGRNPREKFMTFKSKVKLIFIANKIPKFFRENSELYDKVSVISFPRLLKEDGWWSRLYNHLSVKDREDVLSALIFYAHKSYFISRPKSYRAVYERSFLSR